MSHPDFDATFAGRRITAAERAAVRERSLPSIPTFVPAHPTSADPRRAWPSLGALCRELHRRRGRAGLRLTPSTGAFFGGPTFPIFEIYRVGPDGDDEQFIGIAAVQDVTQRAFEAALRAAEPHRESRDPALHQPERMLVL
jgi:hypothetical protein